MRANLVERAEDWGWGSLWHWLHARELKLLSRWPLARLPRWIERVNQSLSEEELAACRLSTQHDKPLGDKSWVESIARRLKLESITRPRGRKRVRFPKELNKEA